MKHVITALIIGLASMYGIAYADPCPKNYYLSAKAPLSFEQLDSISRLNQRPADLALAHAKQQPKDEVALKAAINRLLRYDFDVKSVCSPGAKQ